MDEYCNFYAGYTDKDGYGKYTYRYDVKKSTNICTELYIEAKKAKYQATWL